MSVLLRDIAFAWRNALAKPATSLLIVVTLALGIGANTAIFSMAWHVLLAPLPYPDGERLVALQQNEENAFWSYPTLEDFRAQNTVFTELLEYKQYSLTFVGRGEPYQGDAGIVTGTYFEMLGVQPALGRLFVMDDDRDGAEPVIVLSHEFWLSKFAGDPAVIDTTLEMQHSVYRIVGVLPPLPAYPHANDVWITEASDPYKLALGAGAVRQNRRAGVIDSVYGKLQEGVTLEEARRETDVIVQRLVAAWPDAYPDDYSVMVNALKDEMTCDSAVTIALLMALAALVVLIASANVANLNLVRTMARNQELAICEAVGASPGRIARQLLTESLMLSLGGGVLGLLAAWPCLHLLADFASVYTPLASEISMNGAVLAFSFSLALVVGVLSGAASIFGERDINRTLKEGGSRATTSASGMRKRNVLLALQFALAFVVLTVSMLIVLSLWRLNRQDTGYALDQVFAVNMLLNVDLSERELISQKMQSFSKTALTAIEDMPEVSEAAIRSGTPLLQQSEGATLFALDIEDWAADDGETTPTAGFNMVSENFFTLMNIPLLQGRAFTADDDGNAVQVAIVNESFARRYFPDRTALGGILGLRGQAERYSVVGVVADTRSTNLDEVEGPIVYFSYWQFPTEGVNLYVKSAASSAMVATRIAQTVHELDPRQAVVVKPLDEVKAAWLAPARLRATLISLFGLLALVVTLSGVVGAVACNISERVREIGIHVTLGATPSAVVRLFMGSGLKVYGAGLLLGLVLMTLAAPFLAPLLYQTAVMDMRVYVSSAMVLSLAVACAIYLPARRAGVLSPVEALHAE
ncbi:MAG: ADOP family duplicated permease [Gammaproteobacteria bacterium]